MKRVLIVTGFIFLLHLTSHTFPLYGEEAGTPYFIAIGDSIIAGDVDVSSQISYLLAQKWNCTYLNKGISGQTTTQIAARFRTDVVNLKPTMAIIEGGVNDLDRGGDEMTFLNNWESMLRNCRLHRIQPVVLLIMPWSNGTNAQLQTRDIWNAGLRSLAESYAATMVDTDSYLGQFRIGGDEDNLWDILDEYTNDGTHFTLQGNMKIVEAIIEAVNPKNAHCADLKCNLASHKRQGIGNIREKGIRIQENAQNRKLKCSPL